METSQPHLQTMAANHGVFVGEAQEKGRGVFAGRDFQFEDIIEVCPVVLLSDDEIPHVDRTCLYHYYYDWYTTAYKAAVALGYGSLYNHSYNPNAHYIKDMENNVIIIQCLRNIKKDEEITINYNCDPFCKDPVWFRVFE